MPVGESKLTDPLPWDTIPASRYHPFGETAAYLTSLRDASAARVTADPAFAELRQQLARLKSRFDDRSLSLNEAQRRSELAQDIALGKAIAAKTQAEDASVPVHEITVKDANLPGLPPRIAEPGKPSPDLAVARSSDSLDETESTAANAADQLVLDESLRILADYVRLLTGPARPGASPS